MAAVSSARGRTDDASGSGPGALGTVRGGWEEPSLSASGGRDSSGRRPGGRQQEGLPLSEE